MNENDINLHFVGNEWMELEPFVPYEKAPLGLVKPPTNKVVQVNTIAPMPYLCIGKVANTFKSIQNAVLQGAGFNFLGKCADVMRMPDFKSNKVGVANRSYH